MTTSFPDLLAQAVLVLVIVQTLLTALIAAVVTGVLALYIRRRIQPLLAAIQAVQRTNSAMESQQSTQTELLKQVSNRLTEQTHLSAEAGNEQARQSGLLEKLVEAFRESNDMFRIANKPRLMQEDANQRAIIVRRELAKFLANSDFFTTPSDQEQLLADLLPQTRTLIDRRRSREQSLAALFQVIVTCAAEYSQLPALCEAAASMFNSSQTGFEFRARCAEWGIPLQEGTH